MTPINTVRSEPPGAAPVSITASVFLPADTRRQSPRCMRSAASSTTWSTNVTSRESPVTKLATGGATKSRAFLQARRSIPSPAPCCPPRACDTAHGAVPGNHRWHGNGSGRPALPRFQVAQLYCYRVASVVGPAGGRDFRRDAARRPRSPATTRMNSGWPSSSPTSFATSAKMRDAAAFTCRKTNWRASACSEADLLNGRDTPEFQSLMQFQYERAVACYDRALAALPRARTPCAASRTGDGRDIPHLAGRNPA